ncbi:MAG: hypothetical protein ABL895_17365 [Cyclobacteriaceae bacterium]
MKINNLFIFFIITTLIGCNNDSNEVDVLANNDVPANNEADLPASIEGLSLYWDHEVGNKERNLRFEFYGRTELENSYKLVFDYSINKRDILIELVNKIDNGKCPSFPGPKGGDLCSPRGGFSIPDSVLLEGAYKISLKTPDFQTDSELIVSENKYTLTVLPNEYFSSSIKEIYPIPKNLLFGSVVYSGDENTKFATDFFNDLLILGLTKTTVPNYPYRYLSVNEEGKAISSHWPPANHALGFLYAMHNNFDDIVNLAKEHVNKANIKIYLYSGNGDEARIE